MSVCMCLCVMCMWGVGDAWEGWAKPQALPVNSQWITCILITVSVCVGGGGGGGAKGGGLEGTIQL